MEIARVLRCWASSSRSSFRSRFPPGRARARARSARPPCRMRPAARAVSRPWTLRRPRVTLVAGQGEMPRDLLGVADYLREGTVGLPAAAAWRRGVHGRREERMRELDPPVGPTRTRPASSAGASACASTRLRSGRAAPTRAVVRRGFAQAATGRGLRRASGGFREPAAPTALDVRGRAAARSRARTAGFRPRPVRSGRASGAETSARVSRATTRCSAATERGPSSSRRRRSPRRCGRVAPPNRSGARNRPDRLVCQSPDRELGRAGRRRVEPLEVVDREHDLPIGGQPADQRQQRRPDRRRSGGRSASTRRRATSSARRCGPGRTATRPGATGEQIGESGEGEPRLRLGRSCLQHDRAPVLGLPDRLVPDVVLPIPGSPRIASARGHGRALPGTPPPPRSRTRARQPATSRERSPGSAGLGTPSA